MYKRQILESMYEPVFSNDSHGFRPNRSCHTALQQIRDTFADITWFIEGNVCGFYGSMDHLVLINILRRRCLLYTSFPAIEVYHHALWGVLQIESKGELTPDELEWAKKYWMGQASDGWGEGFEQTDIECRCV